MTTASLLPRAPAQLPALPPEVLARLEQRIADEVGRLQRTVQRIEKAEFQRGGDDLDVTALRQGHEASQALRARCAEGLAEWRGALHRLRESPETFGICRGCGQVISWARLDLLPTARRCARC